jgi:hypothetical protein
MANGFLNELSTEDRLAVTRGLGLAYLRMNEPRKAAVMYRIAQEISPDDRTRRSLATAEGLVQAAAKNESRRPLVADALEQDRLVRPRVVTP